jgi:hypothetical protein
VKRWGFVLRRGPVLVPYSQTSSNKREGTTCTYLQLVDAHLHMRWQRCTRVRPTGRGCRRWLVDEGPRAGRGRRHTHTHTWVAPETNPDPFFRQRASSNHIGSDPIRVSPYGSGEYGVYTESEWEPFALFQTAACMYYFVLQTQFSSAETDQTALRPKTVFVDGVGLGWLRRRCRAQPTTPCESANIVQSRRLGPTVRLNLGAKAQIDAFGQANK